MELNTRIGLQKSFFFLTILGSVMYISQECSAQQPEDALEWTLSAPAKSFYPGEAILLNFTIKNTASEKHEIDFGDDEIGNISLKIYDNNRTLISKSDTYQKRGLVSMGKIAIDPNQTTRKKVVLNRLCSTLLPKGKYHLQCDITPPFYGKKMKVLFGNSSDFDRVQPVSLEMDFEIIELDEKKFAAILEDIAKHACIADPNEYFHLSVRIPREKLEIIDSNRELLTFTESKLAVQYQLDMLKLDNPTGNDPALIKTLVKSGTLEAAIGLMDYIEHNSKVKRYPFIKNQAIAGIYILRQTNNADILKATESFVEKYKFSSEEVTRNYEWEKNITD